MDNEDYFIKDVLKSIEDYYKLIYDNDDYFYYDYIMNNVNNILNNNNYDMF
jgi:hypothetical protein